MQTPDTNNTPNEPTPTKNVIVAGQSAEIEGQRTADGGFSGYFSVVAAPPPDVVKSDYLPLRTGQDTNALYAAAVDGPTGRNYQETNDGTGYYHQVPGAPCRTELRTTPEEEAAGLGLPFLKSLAEKQDADAIFVFSNICQILAPVVPMPEGQTREAWIDLDDVAEKCGLFSAKGGTAEREAIRRRVYDNVLFGAKARVVGRRSTRYKDKRTGQPIETEISAVMWAIMNTERPTQPSIFPAHETPRRLQLALNSGFVPMLTSPDLAQFLAGGERIGQISGGQPSGAWARSIGLVLMTAWRIKIQEALAGTLLITRRKLLETYPPKLSPADEILSSNDPGRAKTFWRVAAAELAAQGVVERQGEAEPGKENKGPNGADLPRQGWADDWLDAPVLFLPGPAFAQNLRDVLKNRFAAPVKDLAAKPKNKGGRPRKTAE